MGIKSGSVGSKIIIRPLPTLSPTFLTHNQSKPKMKSALIFVVVVVASVSANPLLGLLGPATNVVNSVPVVGGLTSGLGLTSIFRGIRSAADDDVSPGGRSVRSANPLFGNLLGGNTEEGGQAGIAGINLSGTLGSLIGTSGEAQSASKNVVFFKELHELIYNILYSDNTDDIKRKNKYLARSLVDKVRGGGFCSIQSGKGLSVEFAALVRQ